MRDKPSGAKKPATQSVRKGGSAAGRAAIKRTEAAIDRTYGTGSSWAKGMTRRQAQQGLQDVVAESGIRGAGSRTSDVAAANVARRQQAAANPGSRPPAKAPRKAAAKPKPKGKGSR